MHSTNGAYGHRYILNRYAGLHLQRPLPFVMQHGWIANSVLDCNADALAAGDEVFSWSESCSIRSGLSGMPVAQAIGSPALYLIAMKVNLSRLLKDSLRNRGFRTGLLLIPRHSTRLGRETIEHVEFMDRSLSFSANPHQGTHVLLHPNDVANPEVCSAYRSRGIEILSNPKPLHSYKFIEWQLGLYAAKERVVAQSVSTAVWYAALLGCDIAIDEGGHSMPESWYEREGSVSSSVDRGLLDGGTREMWFNAAMEETGVSSMVSPEMMRKLLNRKVSVASYTSGYRNIARSLLLSSSCGMAMRRRLLK